ncbi:MAG: hypothetical protein EBR72_06115 [Bacteroidetes bacterium]|nr:hypothetical protein [Bacteroidota bacterium]
MKSRTIFTIIGTVHILIGISLIGMIPNFDEAIKTWISSDIPSDTKDLIIGQTRVIIVHSIGIGIILLNCRRLSNITDIKRVLFGYLIMTALILTNIAHGIATYQGGPPMPVIMLYAVGALIGSFGMIRLRE